VVLVVAAAVVEDRKMNCECDFESAEFGKEVYCKMCGMDLGLNPITIRHKEKIELYCCEGCVE
jgi:hypothetical protein